MLLNNTQATHNTLLNNTHATHTVSLDNTQATHNMLLNNTHASTLHSTDPQPGYLFSDRHCHCFVQHWGIVPYLCHHLHKKECKQWMQLMNAKSMNAVVLFKRFAKSSNLKKTRWGVGMRSLSSCRVAPSAFNVCGNTISEIDGDPDICPLSDRYENLKINTHAV